MGHVGPVPLRHCIFEAAECSRLTVPETICCIVEIAECSQMQPKSYWPPYSNIRLHRQCTSHVELLLCVPCDVLVNEQEFKIVNPSMIQFSIFSISWKNFFQQLSKNMCSNTLSMSAVFIPLILA